MRELVHAITGFAVASVIPAACLAVAFPLSDGFDLPSIVVTFVVLYPYSAAAVIALGVPAFALLRPLRPGAWWSVATVGLILGLATTVILRLPSFPNPKDAVIFGPLGAAAALSFWLIWKRGAPAR